MYFLEEEIPSNTDIFLPKLNQSMPVCYSQLVYNISQLNLQMVKAFLWMFYSFYILYVLIVTKNNCIVIF